MAEADVVFLIELSRPLLCRFKSSIVLLEDSSKSGAMSMMGEQGKGGINIGTKNY
jgi:hypothetical protein